VLWKSEVFDMGADIYVSSPDYQQFPSRC